MPLHNVHPLFTIYVKLSNTLPDLGTKPETPCPAVTLATTWSMRQSIINGTRNCVINKLHKIRQFECKVVEVAWQPAAVQCVAGLIPVWSNSL
ncbi:hypothetical protein SFRURICE_003947 [Spodoptera frugiperda]|nr:hypothetical protein SFRURICE_003947 [Spodoptera frugiperda]